MAVLGGAGGKYLMEMTILGLVEATALRVQCLGGCSRSRALYLGNLLICCIYSLTTCRYLPKVGM